METVTLNKTTRAVSSEKCQLSKHKCEIFGSGKFLLVLASTVIFGRATLYLRNVDFLEIGFTGRMDSIFVRTSVTNSGRPSND
jgi:hypothetical protein